MPGIPTQLVLNKRLGKLGVTCVSAQPHGAQVSSLIEGSAAAEAGLNVGDTITAVDGNLVDGHRDAIFLIDQADDVCRLILAVPTRRFVIDKAFGRVGITIQNKVDGRGVLVEALEQNSLAAEHGVLVGDTVLSINGVLVHTHDEAVELVDSQPVVEMVVAADTRQVVLDKASGRKIGVTVANNVDRRGRPFGEGVVVIGLEGRDTLAATRLQLGETILSIDGMLVSDHESAIRLIDDNPGALSLVVGPPVDDLRAVLSRSSVHDSSEASRRSARGTPEPAKPRFVRGGDAPVPLAEMDNHISEADVRLQLRRI